MVSSEPWQGRKTSNTFSLLHTPRQEAALVRPASSALTTKGTCRATSPTLPLIVRPAEAPYLGVAIPR